jgi:hypothetical protein
MKDRSFMHDEIIQILNEYKDNKMDWNASKIANQIVTTHKEEIVSDWIRFNVYNNVRAVVGKYISMTCNKEIDSDVIQLTLDGFEFLQSVYLVKRDNESIGIHIDDLTDEEIMQKVKQYNKAAEGYKRHAKELLRFLKNRKSIKVDGQSIISQN